MQQSDDNSLIPVPIASEAASGNVANIPTSQATAGDGRVSIDLGYPPECAISVAAGGKYPEMQDANGVYKLLSSAIRSIQAWGVLPFNATFAAAIGGYPKYAVCVDNAGAYWVSTADANTTVPGAAGANWKSLFDGLATQSWAQRYLVNSGGGPGGGDAGFHAITLSWVGNKLHLGVDITDVGNIASENWTNANFLTSATAASTYATQSALALEASARQRADSSLSTAINNETNRATVAEALKANLAGGNDFTGNQTFEGNVWFTGASGENAYIYNPPQNPALGVSGDVPNAYWVDQYYARTTALNSETAARTSADSTLQTNITNEANARIAADNLKANLAGGNDFTGNQTFEGNVWFTGASGENAYIYNQPQNPALGVSGDVPNAYWVDQYYARTTALNSETAARTSADSTLQTNITNEANARIAADATKANLAGGNTFTGGDQTVTGTVVFAGATYSQQFIIKEPTFGMIVTLKARRDNTDGTNYAILSYVDSVQSYHEWQFKPDGGIFSTTKNDSVAFRGDLPTSGTITGGTYTKTPMNDGTGRSVLTQCFSVSTTNGSIITFPISLSSPPSHVNFEVNQNSDCDHAYTDATESSLMIHLWAGGNIQMDVMVVGVVA